MQKQFIFINMYYKIEQYEAANQIKYSITYIGGEFDGLKEFYATDLNEPLTLVRFGYTKHPDSL